MVVSNMAHSQAAVSPSRFIALPKKQIRGVVRSMCDCFLTRPVCVYTLIVFLPDPGWAARQYRDKQTMCYVSVHNGTDTNFRRV
jgi:hypothetical protein